MNLVGATAQTNPNILSTRLLGPSQLKTRMQALCKQCTSCINKKMEYPRHVYVRAQTWLPKKESRTAMAYTQQQAMAWKHGLEIEA